MSRRKRSAKLLEDTTLVRRLFGLLMDRAGFIKVIPAASALLSLGSRFDLDIALHVARCYVSCVAQAKRHDGW
jgi:hypothetical protein